MSLFRDHEDVTRFPSYGYREAKHWVVPLRIWVHEPRKLAEDLLVRLSSRSIISCADPTDGPADKLPGRGWDPSL